MAGLGLLLALALPALAQGARDINAGPIWNQPDAQQKCPRVCGQAGGQWTGHWRTTQMGQMSVCNCQMPMTGASQGSGQWSLCARENEPCYIPYPTTVAYGANGVFARKRFTRAGTIDCSNRTFGDPLVGIGKSCHFQVLREAPPPPPAGHAHPMVALRFGKRALLHSLPDHGRLWRQRGLDPAPLQPAGHYRLLEPHLRRSAAGVVKGCQFRVER